MDAGLTQTIAVFCAAFFIGMALAFLPFRAYLKASGARGKARWAGLAAAVGFTAAGIAAYAAVGRPAALDTPYAQAHADREAALKAMSLDAVLASRPEMVLEVIAERARRDPRNPEHPFFAGQYRMMLADQFAAIAANLRAERRTEDAAMAEEEAKKESGRAIQDLQQALRLAPREPRIMIAVADVLAARPGGPPPFVIASLYSEALSLLPQGDPRRTTVEAALQRLSARLQPPPVAPGGGQGG